MKTVIVFYSFDGSTRRVAQEMAKACGADMVELKPIKEIPQKGFMKYFWGGKMATFGEMPPLEEFDFNPQEYDLIVLGTPVWAGKPAPPINTFINKYSFEDKNIAVFTTYDGSPGKTIEVIKQKMGNNKYVDNIGFKAPSKNIEAAAEEGCKWIKGLKK